MQIYALLYGACVVFRIETRSVFFKVRVEAGDANNSQFSNEGHRLCVSSFTIFWILRVINYDCKSIAKLQRNLVACIV